MASYNRVILAGNLTRDPEYKQLNSGQGVCRLGLAVNRQFKNRQTGDNVQEVCYIDVDVWGPQADTCRQYLQKGRPVLVEGRLKLDTWQDNDGQNRSKHSIVADRVVFLGSAAAESDAPEAPQATPPSLEALQKAVKAASFDPQRPMGPKRSAEGDQIAAPKKQKLDEGTIALSDEPVFQDDLPF